MAGENKKPAPKPEVELTPAERFKKLGTARVNNALKQIGIVANVSNRKTYDYTPEQAAKIVKALENKVAAVKKSFDDALAGKTTATNEGFEI